MASSDFVANDAVAISVGTTEAFLSPPNTNNASTNGNAIRSARRVRITNTHATQAIYYRRNGVPTATVNDGIVLAGKTAIFELPIDVGVRPMILGSGASTTGVAEYGA